MFIPDTRTERSPNWKGKFKWKGELLEISAWEEKTQQDKPKLSLTIQVPRQNSETPQRRVDVDAHNASKANGYAPADKDDDLPF